MSGPLCFVLMPFGKKPDAAGMLIDFDKVYDELIAPAITKAGLEPLRADEERTGGIIHKPMYERLILCEYAVADLTTANANVFYELGIRHGVRPHSTVLVFSENNRLPFDVGPLRALPYRLGPDGVPTEIEGPRTALVKRLKDARDGVIDSPLFQLVEGMSPPEVAHLKTDSFREQVRHSAKMREWLAVAKKEGAEALARLEKSLGPIADAEASVVIDLFLAYRDAKAWPQMIALVDKMSPPLASTVMVQEQLALALNRDGQGERAEKVLNDLLEHRGPSSETYGILGRVYKDRWEAALRRGEHYMARGVLNKAIEAYLRGFEADWRDAYPGINACTLMELSEPPDPRRLDLLPVVTYAIERRIALGKPDYWDHATRLELAVLARNGDMAEQALSDALAYLRAPWEAETTARNLRLIRETRERRSEADPWANKIEAYLADKAKP